jgi:hypothetical protein
MNTLAQPVVGLTSRLPKGKDLRFTRQGGLASVDPQRLIGSDRKSIHSFDLARRINDQGSFSIRVVIRQSLLEASPFGLSQTFEGEQGLSAFTRYYTQKEELAAVTRPSSYVKNGILVHHAGTRITSEDVAKALAEE